MNEAVQQKPSANAKRGSARLMAVQAVYQMAVNRKEPAFVVDEYLFLRKNMEIDGEMLVEPDDSLFKDIVLGVAERLDDLKTIVSANRPVKEGQIQADEPLLMAVFLCGTYELLAHHDIDSPVIISSYVDVAKAFFEGGEPGLANGVLDSIGKILRA
jgi:N utilization substance protein B